MVFVDGRWHLYMTRRIEGRPADMAYAGFARWEETARVRRVPIRLDNTYHCAPQVLHYRPKKQWYLIYQWADESRNPPEFGPAFSTLEHPGKPESLSKPRHLFERRPEHVKGWLDFWVIADESHAYLFFTTLDGRMWRSRTQKEDFPLGWDRPVLALQADIFEASHTYRLKGDSRFLTIIEAQDSGRRYYKAYLADRLDGDWKPLADSREKPFASRINVEFEAGVEPWTDSISHGELIRDGFDESMTVDPRRLRFVIQGCSAKDREDKNYGQFPWRRNSSRLMSEDSADMIV